MFEVHVFGAERMPSAAAYSAAKAAIVSLSESLRAELAPDGIEVVLFAPPHTSTDGGRAWPLEGPRVHTPEWAAGELLDTLRRGRASRVLLAIRRIAPAYAAYLMRGIGLRAVAKAEAQRSRAA
jgi:NAD(P)-dependent dehydrogenase (short-subunit alcohol dehydrogenase family)